MKTIAAIVAALTVAIAPALARSPGQASLDEGAAQYRQGQFKAALESFRRAVDLDPSLTKAWENLGWAHHRLGDDAEALRVWQNVLKLEPENVASWNAVGEVRFDREEFAAAAAAYERSLALQPGQTDVQLRLGQADEALKRLDAAEAQYAAILQSHPGFTKATIRLADLEEARGDLDASERTLRAGLSRGNDTEGQLTRRLARVLGRRGDAAFDAARFADAKADYAEAARLDPSRTVYQVNLGWAQRKAGDGTAAVASWKAALAAGAGGRSDLWRAIGDAERDAGRAEAARAAYLEASRADPGSRSALFALASLSFADGRTRDGVKSLHAMLATDGATEDDAVRAAELLIHQNAVAQAGSLFDAWPTARARLAASEGAAAYRTGDDAAAVAAYKRALQGDPRNRAALRDYGWTLWRQGDWDGVRRLWSDYAAAYPDLSEPYELMGRLELQHGDPKAAVTAAQAALARTDDTRGPNVLLTRAWLADGKYKTARELGAKLAAASPDDLAMQTLYAETLWRSLDFAASKTQWRKVIDMGGDTPRATHYWLRSLYETGDADAAVAAAEAAVAAGRATEPVMRLLAEDALVRGDTAATVRWYRELTVKYPQRIAYWTALAEADRAREERREELGTLEAGLSAHPDSPELALLRAESELALGRPKRALGHFRALEGRLGRNRSVFEGQVDALRGLGRWDEALALVRSTGPSYLDADEQAITEASILEDLGRRSEAAVRRSHVTAPPAGSVVLPILLYHGIADHPRTLNVPVDRFEAEMRALRDAGFHTITVSQLDAMLAGRTPFPERPILVTFDDARADSMRWADPVLERLHMNATMFVPTVRIADESAFNTDWPTLRRLAASGRWDFQAHGHLAHDPIAVDAEGGMAEFLVNRGWLPEAGRLETHDEYVARVETDYESCRALLAANLGSPVVAYAFPFSEMGQLHGGNDPQALGVNEAAFAKRYRYGFIQSGTGYNTLTPGERGPLLLRRFSVPRTWDAGRLMAHLAAAAPAERARLDGAEADIADARYRKAEADLRRTIEERPLTSPAAGPVLARALHEQERDLEAEQTYAQVPSGPAWGTPEPPQRKLAADIAWEAGSRTGATVEAVSDSDHRDTVALSATGRYAFDVPVALTGTAGGVEFRDKTFPSLSGGQALLDATWKGSLFGAGGWLRGRGLSDGIHTLSGQATLRATVDGQRFGVACGVTDVDTVGAIRDGVQSRGCDLAYDAIGRIWRARARLSYGSLTDGNSIVYGWADATVSLARDRRISLGGRFDAGESQTTSPLYYAPSGLVTLLGIARYGRSFPSGAGLEAEAGLGPSRDDTSSVRLVGEARVAWTQDWASRWRSELTAEYSETPNYRRAALTASFGYRF
ncbi:MAG TPA: tetratricopeptide repeat protein [Candidatus Polarisedimenticolaceae bacterium]|nr:tetratricopeptide repeat protein [Candidatus Polarisedimenticolaceae bacterium]